MAVTIQVRRDTSANWVSANPVPNQGEPCLETDTGRFKYGDGSTSWTALPYAAQQLTPVTKSSAYTANPGDYVKANVSSAGWTLKLPQAPPANAIVGAKVITQVAAGAPNTLTVACQGSDVFEASGGTTSTSLSLLSQAAAWQYNGGYWTRLSDDLPLGQLDNRYGKIFSPMAFGAAGNGTADDTTAVTAAFTTAVAAGGIIDLGTYTFLTSSAIPLVTGVRLRGSEMGGGGALVNNTSDLFSLSGTVSSFTIENCSLTASAGHIVNCAASSTVAFGKIRACYITQSSASHGIWYMPNGTYLNMYVGDDCTLVCNSAATVAPWYIVGLANSNTWQSTRATAGTSVTVPFFWVECDSASAFSSGNTFRDIAAEVCVYGIIHALTVSNLTIEQVLGYDVTGSYSASLFYVGTGTGGGRSQDITCRNSGRIGGTLGSGAYDFQAAGTTQSITLENVGPESGSSSYSVPSSYTTIIGGVNSDSYVQSSMLAAAGNAQPSVAQSRLVGGSTVTGAPTAGTWNTLDIFADSAGVIWVCTSGGTPGTWIASNAATPPDVQWFTSSGTWTKPSGAGAVQVTLQGPGGGGGSGRQGAASTVRCGGGGGGSGGFTTRTFSAADVGSSVLVTVGTGGSGGAAQSTADTNGNNGGSGSGATSFGSLCFANNGTGGGGGTNAAGTGGAGGTGTILGGGGAAASTTGGIGGSSGTNPAVSGGASGGGITSANAASNGGSTGASVMGTATNTGGAGVVDTTIPTGGTQPTVKGTPSCGGGGGAGSITTAAQAGATAFYAGGGGGGGASLDGNASGAGGAGGAGFALIITYFA